MLVTMEKRSRDGPPTSPFPNNCVRRKNLWAWLATLRRRSMPSLQLKGAVGLLTASLGLCGLRASCHCRPASHRATWAPSSIVFAYWYHNRSRQSAMKDHVKALTSPYPGSQVERWPVPPEKVSWSVDWPEYQPVDYTAPAVLARPVWADPPHSEESFHPKYNALDGHVERTSFEGVYLVENGKPRNPRGRTGVTGRGLLGRWGPNHAADPIITRWKRNAAGEKVTDSETGKAILQFVAIQRRDCGQWAIPGGMVDPGELITATLRREFCEEALNSLEKSGEEKDTQERIQSLFSQEHLPVYSGYVDDPRNTDNSWMETQAVNYHDDTGHILDQLALEAGDDAGKVQWVDISQNCSLYANHALFIQIVAEKRGAHW